MNPLAETLTIPRPQGGALNAYLAKPAGAGPFPGVVAIHEMFGLNENIRDIARQLEARLEARQVVHDIKIYPDTRHSFFNDTGPAYNAEAAADAWKRTLTFFEKHLQKT